MGRPVLSVGVRSTLPLLGGLVTQAVTTYAVLVIAGRTLGPVGFAALSGLYLLLTSVATGLFQPLEQEITRRRGAERATGTFDRTLLRRGLQQGLVAATTAVAVAVAALPFTLRVLGDEPSLVVALCVALPGYACWFAVRGELAGRGALGRYGAQLVVDGTFRLVGAAALAAAGLATTGSIGALFGLSPWVALAATLGARTRPGRTEPHPVGSAPGATASLTRPLYLLIASAIAAQLLINAGPLVVSLLATGDDRERAGVFLAALVVIRVPVFLFTAVQPAFLPALARHVADGGRDAFTRLLSTVLGALAGLAALTCVGATAVGPPLVSTLFDFDERLDRLAYLELTAAVGLFLVATVLAQAVLALGLHRWVTRAWLLGIAGLVIGTVPGQDVVARATHGLLFGAAAAVVVLTWVILSALRTWASRTAPPGSTADVGPSRDHVSRPLT